MIYSFWPEVLGFDAWVTHSDLGIAVSENCIGPYRSLGRLFKEGGCRPQVRHNPSLLAWGDEWFLYFTGNSGPLHEAGTKGDISMRNPDWWVHRNHQRVWLARTKNPLGDWEVGSEPAFPPEPGFVMTATPFCFERDDGSVQAVIKTVREGGTPRGGGVTHLSYRAAHPGGPFKRVGESLLKGTRTDFPVDDHCEFFYRGKYYAVVKDHGECLTEHGIALILLESEDGLDWTVAPNPLVKTFELPTKSGEVERYERLEMPRVVFVDGEPRALQLSAYRGDESPAFNLRLELVPPD